MVPGPVKARRADKKNRQPAPKRDRRADGGGVNQHPDPGDTNDLRMIHFGNEGGFLRVQPPTGIEQHQFQACRHVDQAGEIGDPFREDRRTHQLDFRIAADNDRVGMVPCVTPAPGIRVPDHAEACHLINGVVEPSGLECRLVPAFMPARIHRRSIKNAIGKKARQSQP